MARHPGTRAAHKLARAVYSLLRRGHAFDANTFFPGIANEEPSMRSEVDVVPAFGQAPRSSGRRRAGHTATIAEVGMSPMLDD